MINETYLRTAVAALLFAGASSAGAASAVLNTGTIRMGVFDNAGLGALGVGFDSPVGGDSIIRGCLCEGWGASAGSSAGYVYGGSGTGLSSSLLTTTDSSGLDLSAQSVVTMLNGLQVTHTYSAISATLFGVAVTLTNTTGGTLADVRYARVLDWDVAPGFFSENYTTIYGGSPTGPAGQVLHTSSNPFTDPNPLAPPSQEANMNIVNSIGDKGGFWSFGFGSLAAGGSASFTTVIGAERTVSLLLSSLTSAGVGAYSYTTGSAFAGGDFAPAYGYGFVGLSLPPIGTVPEPGTLALLGVAALGAAALRRRQAAR